MRRINFKTVGIVFVLALIFIGGVCVWLKIPLYIAPVLAGAAAGIVSRFVP